uniref:Uncharacterized protein n=1 Tax=Oryza punctata TaxID=4537 RepID=A0A0E0LPH0_ORYPU
MFSLSCAFISSCRTVQDQHSCQLANVASVFVKVGKMTDNLTGDCSTSSKKRKKACKSRGETRKLHVDNIFEEEFGSLKNFGQGAWSELSKVVISNLSESVVSLASFDGNTMHSACTGIVIKTDLFGTSFLTSASLVRSFDDENKIMPFVSIEIHLPKKQVAHGWLYKYDLQYNIAIVETKVFPGLRAINLEHQLQFESHSKVVAVGRCFKSGKLMATSGVLTDDPSGVYRKELMISTCEITMVGVGGPLIDLDGNFVGMNFYAKKRTPFLPRSTITECMANFKTYRGELKKFYSTTGRNTNEIQESPATSKSYLEGLEGCSDSLELRNSSRKPENEQESSSSSDSEVEDDPFFMEMNSPFLPVADGDEFGKFLIKKLTSQGYPLPAVLDGGMRLVNTFENEFADDIWSKLTKKVAANMSRIVVSLASFNGEERIFACTGIFVGCNESNTRILTSASLVRISDDENKINDNLKIVVHLPNKQQTVGTLQHYHLHYNVAIVSIKGFRCLRTEEFHDPGQIERKEVISVGRVFKSGKLMATSGILTDKPSKLDCKELMVSTCRISKAGIGGPLIDCHGNFVGMNFYGRKETPYLPRDIIMKLLSYFDGEGRAAGEQRSRRRAIEAGGRRVGSMTDNLTGDCSTSSKKRKKACKSRGETGKLHVDNIFEEEFGSLKNSGQGAWSELSKVAVSNLSESVVSLASFNGNTMHFACTGIVIETDSGGTSYLTSASLIRSFHDESKIMPFVSIEIHLPKKKQVAHGWLADYDLQYNIAVIETKFFPDLRPIDLEHQLQFEFHSKAGIGGPLIDFHGNFVGMNFYGRKETPYLPRDTILKLLSYFDGEGDVSAEIMDNQNRNRWPVPKIRWHYPHFCKPRKLEMPKYIKGGGAIVGGGGRRMRTAGEQAAEAIDGRAKQAASYGRVGKMKDNLTGDCSTSSKKRKKACKSRGETGKLHVDNIFEEEFGSLKNSGQGAWSELSKVAVSNLSESVVSLASFNGNTMHFACTGIVIETDSCGTNYLTSASLIRSFHDESKIMPFLSIEIHLPKKQVAHGWLYKYDLQYNIAIVETKLLPGLRAINLEHQLQFEFHSKAGIGGPLIDFHGNFVGMNFYGRKETPYLPRDTILKLLSYFDGEGDVSAEIMDNQNRNRWPVPKIRWHYPHFCKPRKLERPKYILY